jgi:hypothetical protein
MFEESHGKSPLDALKRDSRNGIRIPRVGHVIGIPRAIGLEEQAVLESRLNEFEGVPLGLLGIVGFLQEGPILDDFALWEVLGHQHVVDDLVFGTVGVDRVRVREVVGNTPIGVGFLVPGVVSIVRLGSFGLVLVGTDSGGCLGFGLAGLADGTAGGTSGTAGLAGFRLWGLVDQVSKRKRA